MPLESTQGYRALRHKAFHSHHDFCLVYLKPGPSSRYVNKFRYYENISHSEIEICNSRHDLFGALNSQFREHSYWFLRATSLEEIHQKGQLLGDFSKSSPTGIKLNYISNAEEFQQRVEQGDKCVTKMDDIERCLSNSNGGL